MVYQSSIQFSPPSQYRLHMAADPQGIAYLAVLDPYNQPIANLHHLKVPLSEIVKMCEEASGSITAKADQADVTIAVRTDVHPLDFHVTCDDHGEGVTTTSSVRRGDVAELLALLQAPAAG